MALRNGRLWTDCDRIGVTALVAKQATEVDVLSGGRLRLGVGIGWNTVEYQALGESFTNRGVRSEEQIDVLRALWAEPTITYAGRWRHVDNAGIKPRPIRRRIPIWLGGNAEVVLRRVGRIGDGWLPQRAPDGVAQAMLDRIRRYAEEAGRAPEAIGFEPRLSLAEGPRLSLAEGQGHENRNRRYRTDRRHARGVVCRHWTRRRVGKLARAAEPGRAGRSTL
jgi:hypothetical protein